MNWRVMTAVLLLTATLSCGVFCRAQVKDLCDKMTGLLEQCETDPEALDRAAGLWEESLPWLSSLLNHEPLELLGTTLARAQGCRQAGDPAGMAQQVAAAMYQLDDIGEYDDISLKNLI